MHMAKYRKSDLPDLLGRSRATIDRYVERGSLPEPTDTVGRSGLWDSSDLDRWFGSLNEHVACVVSVDTLLGLRELAAENVYVCPTASGRNIGLERPSILGFFLKGGGGKVDFYSVEAVEIVGRGPLGTKKPKKKARRIIKARKKAGFDQTADLAIFRLADSVLGTLTLSEVVQNARVTSSTWVRENFDGTGLTLPPTDRLVAARKSGGGRSS
jgi:predicted DNA-binding transcriptional regulator AlpA